MFCRNCGKQISDDDIFCRYCGAEQSNEEQLHAVSLKEATDNQSIDAPQKKSHGFLKFLLVVIIIGACIFGFVKFVQCQQANQIVDGHGTTQGNSDGNTHLFKRSANINDISFDYDFDLANLGEKIIIIPHTDIDGLQITINFLDSNKKILTSISKSLGNVKQGVQVSFSISLMDLGISVAWNTKYNSIAVTGGTVSYFK